MRDCLQELLCVTWTCLSTRACDAVMCDCLQELVLHLDVSVLKSLCCTCAFLSTGAFCCTWTCLSTRACAAPGRVLVLLHELFCFCTAPGVPVYKSLCWTYACPSTKAVVLHLNVHVFKNLCCSLCVSVYKSFVLHLDVFKYRTPHTVLSYGVETNGM